MKNHHISLPHLVAAVFVTAIFALEAIVPVQNVYAGQIINRSLTLRAGATDGGSKPGGTVNHFFQFTLPSTSSIGSIQFEYCTTAALACIPPNGIDTTGASLGTEAGWTGVSVIKAPTTSTNVFYLKKAVASGFGSANTVVSYEIAGIKNPSDKATFYVRIKTFASTDTTGTEIDSGVVAAATNEPIVLSGIMPESLVFCTGGNIYTTSGVPDCANASNTNGSISFNQLFSPTDTAVATSQMAASTNAGWGYIITVNGSTLMSGSDSILPMTTMGPPVKGVSQFGMNLMQNTAATNSVIFGQPVTPNADAVDYTGVAATGYNTADSFKYTSGDIVATSNPTNAPSIGATNAQIYTAYYIANVPGKQAAGTYSTTLTYICTATF